MFTCGEQTTAGGGGSFMAIPETGVIGTLGSWLRPDSGYGGSRRRTTLTAGIPAESFTEQVTGFLANTFPEVPSLTDTASRFWYQ